VQTWPFSVCQVGAGRVDNILWGNVVSFDSKLLCNELRNINSVNKVR